MNPVERLIREAVRHEEMAGRVRETDPRCSTALWLKAALLWEQALLASADIERSDFAQRMTVAIRNLGATSDRWADAIEPLISGPGPTQPEALA